jgi:DNA-binding transcriptional LysR family regulator
MAVAEELHFGRAAKRLHISQPPLSQQIRALEEELHVALFSRSNRRVELTHTGLMFLSRARAILRQADEAKLEMHNVAIGEGGRLRIGYMSAAMLTNLPEVLSAFRASRPHVRIAFSELSVESQLHAIAEAEIDVGFLDLVGRREAISVRDETLRLERVWREEMVVIVPPGHPLAGRKLIQLDALVNEPLIILPKSPFFGFYDRVAQVFAKAGKEPRIAQIVDRFPEIITLVAAGFGVSFAPRSSASIWYGDVEFVSIAGHPKVDVSVVWNEANLSPLVAVFRECLNPLKRRGWPLRQVAQRSRSRQRRENHRGPM